jgi:glutamate mutase epsilon subunit
MQQFRNALIPERIKSIMIITGMVAYFSGIREVDIGYMRGPTW